jgi:hypothetical protein
VTPTPTLQELIDGVRADVPGEDALVQLSQASYAAAELEQTTDALLGHFVDQCRRNGCSWSEISGALGVSKQAAHKRFSFDAPTSEPFTERSRTVLEQCEQQAHRLGHGFVGTEHILLALCEVPDGPTPQVFGEAGITKSVVEDQILAFIKRGTRSDHSKLPFTPRAKAALQNAMTEAQELGHTRIAPEHLLLGLFKDGTSVAARILVATGTSYDQAKLRITELSKQR